MLKLHLWDSCQVLPSPFHKYGHDSILQFAWGPEVRVSLPIWIMREWCQLQFPFTLLTVNHSLFLVCEGFPSSFHVDLESFCYIFFLAFYVCGVGRHFFTPVQVAKFTGNPCYTFFYLFFSFSRFYVLDVKDRLNTQCCQGYINVY